MAWFSKGRSGEQDPDDEDTGRIAAQVMADAVGRHVPDPAKAGAPAPPPIQAVHTLDDGAPRQQDDDLRAQRATLIELCLYALDRARSGGVVERLEQGLATVGVKAVRPDGERFDPAVHEAGGTVSTSDTALDGTVAETEVVGFTDGDKLLRAPIVTVYAAKSEGQ